MSLNELFHGNQHDDTKKKPRRNSSTEVLQYFYKGKETDLVIYVTSQAAADDYLASPSPSKLANVVEVFKVFTNLDGKGATGTFGEASKTQLENEFGKGKKVEEVIGLILKEGVPNGKTNRVKTEGNFQK